MITDNMLRQSVDIENASDGTLMLRCCGIWIEYPMPGHMNMCQECGTVFETEDDQ